MGDPSLPHRPPHWAGPSIGWYHVSRVRCDDISRVTWCHAVINIAAAAAGKLIAIQISSGQRIISCSRGDGAAAAWQITSPQHQARAKIIIWFCWANHRARFRNLQILIIFLLSQVKIYYCYIFLNNFTHLRRDREQKSIYQNKTNYLARQFLNPAKRFDISSS